MTVEIDTLWNVKACAWLRYRMLICRNRYIVECKVPSCPDLERMLSSRNRYIVECKAQLNDEKTARAQDVEIDTLWNVKFYKAMDIKDYEP